MSARRRWLYTSGGQPLPEPIEISEDLDLAEKRAPVSTEAIAYDGLRATDGTPIDTRRRHREYMKERGLALFGDFSPESQARDRAAAAAKSDASLHDQIGRLIHDIDRGGEKAARKLAEQTRERATARARHWSEKMGKD